MKRLTASLLALCVAVAVAGNAGAQTLPLSPAPQTYGGNAYGAQNGYGAQYDYARVVNVVRVPGGGYQQSGYGPQGQRCYTQPSGGYVSNRDPYNRDGYYGNDGSYGNDGYYGNNGYRTGGSETGRQVATVLGGVVGAVLGSQIGGGSARYATSALGSMVGGMAGRTIYERNAQPRRGQVTVCDPVVRGSAVQTSGYGNNGYADAYDVTYEYAGRRYTTRMNYNPGDRVRVRVDVSPE